VVDNDRSAEYSGLGNKAVSTREVWDIGDGDLGVLFYVRGFGEVNRRIHLNGVDFLELLGLGCFCGQSLFFCCSRFWLKLP
jgi:hypothetical protein